VFEFTFFMLEFRAGLWLVSGAGWQVVLLGGLGGAGEWCYGSWRCRTRLVLL